MGAGFVYKIKWGPGRIDADANGLVGSQPCLLMFAERCIR